MNLLLLKRINAAEPPSHIPTVQWNDFLSLARSWGRLRGDIDYFYMAYVKAREHVPSILARSGKTPHYDKVVAALNSSLDSVTALGSAVNDKRRDVESMLKTFMRTMPEEDAEDVYSALKQLFSPAVEGSLMALKMKCKTEFITTLEMDDLLKVVKEELMKDLGEEGVMDGNAAQ